MFFNFFMTLVEIAEFVLAGNRLPLDGIDPTVADVIGRCWAQNYKDRPGTDAGLVCFLTI